jgi:hypothetical protein
MSSSLFRFGLITLLRLAIIFILFSFIFYNDKYNIVFMNSAPQPTYDLLIVRIVKSIIWIIIISEIVRIYKRVFVDKKRNPNLEGVSLSIITVVISLILLEIVFMFVPQAHEGSLTKASHIWMQKYWGPTNSFGYRDKEPKHDSSKKTIAFLGDSYTSGAGLKFPSERYSDIIASKLEKNKYEIYNLGLSGIDTKEEAKNVNKFPIKSDVIVLSYFVNDIEVAASANGLKFEANPTFSELPSFLVGIFNRFYFPNFVYWQLPKKPIMDFDKYLTKAYTDPRILEEHLNDLQRIVDYKVKNNSEMVVLMIPFLFDLDYTDKYTKPITDFFAKNNITVVTVSDEISKIKPSERTAGKLDSHASPIVNEVIAEKLYKTLKEKLNKREALN